MMGRVYPPTDQQPHPPLRRKPVQQRSADRLARILDACAEVLDETGYEGLSTRAVAQRAGVPIGSVYRFFSNKRAMADALAHRNLDVYIERVREQVDADRLGVDPPLDWRRAIDIVLDVYIEMKQDMPGFALLDFSVPSPTERDGGANHLVAQRLCDLLAGPLGRAPDADLQRTFLIGVEAADALLQLAFRTAPAGDPLIIRETKELLRAYLARILD